MAKKVELTRKQMGRPWGVRVHLRTGGTTGTGGECRQTPGAHCLSATQTHVCNVAGHQGNAAQDARAGAALA